MSEEERKPSCLKCGKPTRECWCFAEDQAVARAESAPQSQTDELRDLAIKAKSARTEWFENCGVPIAEEFATFAEAIGLLIQRCESVAGPVLPPSTPALDLWVILYADNDMPPELVLGEAEARERLESHLPNWDCQLFKMVDDGKRERPVPPAEPQVPSTPTFDWWMIRFDDSDMLPEVIWSEAEAKKRFKSLVLNWNCQLFRMVDDGKRSSELSLPPRGDKVIRRLRKWWLCRKYGICPIHGVLRPHGGYGDGTWGICSACAKENEAKNHYRDLSASALRLAAIARLNKDWRT